VSIFDKASSVGHVFQRCDGEGTTTLLSFSRISTSQNSAGEIIASFTGSVGATLLGDLQPIPRDEYVRLQGGTIAEADFLFLVEGNPDVNVGDRATISATRVEAIEVDRWGKHHAEIFLRYMGR
jgi:hypothetical protein